MCRILTQQPVKKLVMPPKKINKNKPKSAKRMNHGIPPIRHSSTTFQVQDISGQEESKVRISAMEDSSNGKVEETREVQSVDECKDVVVEDVEDSSKLIGVESVKVLETNDENNSDPASERGISSIEQTVVCLSQKALVENEKEEIDDGSSPAETEEKTLTSSSFENDVVADFVSKCIEETKLQSSNEDVTSVDQKDEANPASEEVSEGIEGPKLPILEENSTGESSQAASEAASGNACNPETAETTGNPSAVPVTRPSLQATSWTSCCGLFEVLRRSN